MHALRRYLSCVFEVSRPGYACKGPPLSPMCGGITRRRSLCVGLSESASLAERTCRSMQAWLGPWPRVWAESAKVWCGRVALESSAATATPAPHAAAPAACRH